MITEKDIETLKATPEWAYMVEIACELTDQGQPIPDMQRLYSMAQKRIWAKMEEMGAVLLRDMYAKFKEDE